MKHRQYLLGAAVMVALLGQSVFAAEIRGIIRTVDPAKGELTLEARGRGMRGMMLSFTLTGDTRVLVGARTAVAADVKPGDRAVITYETKDGQRVVGSVTVRRLLDKAEPANVEAVKPDANTVTGTIERISFTERELVVVGAGLDQSAKAETLLTVPENASVTRAKKAIKLDDVREGESVVARTAKKDGKVMVVSMEVGTGAKEVKTEAARGEKIRAVLKIADFFLQRMGQKQGPPVP